MAKWTVKNKTVAIDHAAQMKITHTAGGLRIESAYPYTPTSIAAQEQGFSDGKAVIELGPNELQQLRRALGWGGLHVDNRTHYPITTDLRVAELQTGEPYFQLTLIDSALEERDDDQADDELPEFLGSPPAPRALGRSVVDDTNDIDPEQQPLFERFKGNVPKSGLSAAAGRRLEQAGKLGAVVSSDDASKPRKPAKKRRGTGRKPGRPRSVRPESA